MIFFGLYLGKKVPFHTVYLHGLVNDANGKKMSKSKGNVINPLTITDKYGTDALRMALVVGNTPGTNLALNPDKVKGYKHFSNKLWNITRFILDRTSTVDTSAELTPSDKAILDELKSLEDEVTKDLEAYRIHLAAEKLYHFTWHRLADEIIEESKEVLTGDDTPEKSSRSALLQQMLDHILRLLHPFMPFVTEEIWQRIPDKDEKLLMIAAWPR